VGNALRLQFKTPGLWRGDGVVFLAGQEEKALRVWQDTLEKRTPAPGLELYDPQYGSIILMSLMSSWSMKAKCSVWF